MASSPIECCDASGGRVVITANGQTWSARSAVEIMPLNYERTVGSNQDGTIYTQFKPIPAEATFSLSDFCGMKLEDIMACPIDISITLVDVHRTYFFTSALVVGRPSLNSETGEIKGFKATSNNVTYRNT